MDWGALSSRDAVLAICEHFRIDFAQARDHLRARQLHQAEETEWQLKVPGMGGAAATGPAAGVCSASS
mgnify:CR=1 FL=1